jgi:tetratricopeptide (TPR) repeat protein
MSSREQSSVAYTNLLQNVVAQDATDGPIAPLLLAIRAGRRAVSEQPDNSTAYLAMGEAYLRLTQVTKERYWVRTLPEFAEILRDQAITALSEAVRLNPNLLPAHLELADIYRHARLKERNQPGHDLYLREMKEILRITKADWVGDAGKEERIKFLQEEIGRLETMVDQLRQRIPKEQGASVLVRAEAAFRLGLYGDALDTLLKADYAEFGDGGLQLQVEALLFTGRAADVLDWVAPSHREAIGAIAYHWARARAAACVGAYAEFDIQMRELRELLTNIPAGNGVLIPLQIPIVRGLGHVVLDGAIVPSNPGQFQLGTIGQREAMDQIRRLSNGLRQGAKGDVLRGLLALEQGDITRAERLCRDAIRLWTGPQQVERGEGLDFTGRSVAEQLLQLLQAAR